MKAREEIGSKNEADLRDQMNHRTKMMKDSLIKRSLGDRSEEWFKTEMFTKIKDIPKTHTYDSVLIRRAEAIDVMLKAMTDKDNSEKTLTAEIFPEDLLLGTLPMGSNGLGKVFPEYLNEYEKRAGSVTNRGSMSLLGHNTIDYTQLLNKGLKAIIDECDANIHLVTHGVEAIIEELEKDKKYLSRGLKVIIEEFDEDKKLIMKGLEDIFEKRDVKQILKMKLANHSLLTKHHLQKQQTDFYAGVKTACQSVIDYANRMADIAKNQAEEAILAGDKKRHDELKAMETIARKVPEQGASNFREAVQSIWFYHLALHASMNLISFGRLDQVLNPFLEKEEDQNACLEIFEQMLIKAAWRLNLNLTPENIVKQDHVDNETVLGVSPYLIDQKAGVNNFLQNIIVGGITPEGKDATNDCTFLILQAFANVNLSTPGIYVRMGSRNKEELTTAVAKCWKQTKNNPAVINDDVMIPALKNAMRQGLQDGITMDEIESLANDFCVDGCWEPILNGKSDWTFGMLSALTPLECAMNEGAMLTNDIELLRGQKQAPRSKKPHSYEDLMEAFDEQLGFFVDQRIISLFLYYMIDEYACPSPLLSAYLSGCMEKGRGKAWGGSDYNLGGIILSGVPNVINTLAAIKMWVFPEEGEGKYTMDEVREALRNNYDVDVSKDSVERLMDKKRHNLYKEILNDFSTNTPTFGNGIDFVDSIAKDVLDIYYRRVMSSAKYAKKVFQDKPSKEEESYIVGLRSIAGYYGKSLEEKFGDFNMMITAGLGTFEQYNWMGKGNAASADRLRAMPLAPNFSPVSGTAKAGIGGVWSTLSKLELERFAAGVITDTCLETKASDLGHLSDLLQGFIKYGGGMMTLAIGDKELYTKIYKDARASIEENSTEETIELLKKYADINVRIGGWQTPFITLPLSHMENYIERPVGME